MELNLEKVQSLTDDQLLEITVKKYTPRQLWEHIAYETIVYPRFLVTDKEVLIFGCIQCGFKVYDIQELVKDKDKFSSYELMTLREVSPPTYNLLAKLLPKADYMVNYTTKEFVKLEGPIKDIKQHVLNKWKPTDNIQMIERPIKLMHRNYKDVTEEFTKDLYDHLVVGEGDKINLDSDEESEIETESDTERLQLQAQVFDAIRDRLYSKYGKQIDNYKNSKMLLFATPTLLLPLHKSFVPTNAMKSNKNYRIVWSTQDLLDESNPSNEQLPFYETLADLFDYFGTR